MANNDWTVFNKNMMIIMIVIIMIIIIMMMMTMTMLIIDLINNNNDINNKLPDFYRSSPLFLAVSLIFRHFFGCHGYEI